MGIEEEAKHPMLGAFSRADSATVPGSTVIPGRGPARSYRTTFWFCTLILGLTVHLSSQSLVAQSDSVIFVSAYPRFGSGTLVLDLLQDKIGFIWILTPWSITRYDGYSYQRYYGREGKLFGSATNLWNLAGGRSQFISANAAANRILFLNTDVYETTVVSLLDSACGHHCTIGCVMQDSSGRFWVGCLDGNIMTIRPPEMTVMRIFNCDGEHQPGRLSSIQAMAQDVRGNIWIGGDGGLYCLAPHTIGDDLDASRLEKVTSLPSDSVVQLLAGRDGRIWIGMRSGDIGSIDPEDMSYRRATRASFRIGPSFTRGTVFLQDNLGDLWLPDVGGGIHHWHSANGIWDKHLVATDPSGKQHAERVTGACVDKDGALWVATSSQGLLRYAAKRRMFNSYTPVGGRGPKLRGEDINALAVDQTGGLWVGKNSDGIEYLPVGGKSFNSYVHDPADPHSLSDNVIVCMRVMRSGEIWIGTIGRGVSIGEPGRESFGHYRHNPGNPGSLRDDVVTVIYEDSRSRVWVGHYRGIDIFDRRTQTFFHFVRWPEETLGLVGSAAAMLEDDRGYMWIGTADRGLLRVTMSTGDTVWYRHDSARQGSLPSDNIPAVFQDREGRLWIGAGMGLGLLDYMTGRFQNFEIPYPQASHGVGPGAPPPAGRLGVSGIAQDARGDLWLALSTGGLARFNPESRTFRRFGTSEGVVVRGARRSAFCISKDGTVYYGGTGGITWFHPDSIERDAGTCDAPVVISEFRVNHQARVLANQTSASVLLSHSENTCSFVFAMLDYTNPRQYLYEYILEGLETDWSLAGSERTVTYGKLPPGEYRFRVRGANANGVWSSQEASVALVIDRPYWLTWWAYSIYGALIFGLFYGGYRLRLREVRLKQQAEMEHFQTERLAEVDKMKSRFFSNVSHEFRTPLTLIRGLNEQLRSGSLDPTAQQRKHQLIEDNVGRVGTLVDQLLDLSRLEMGRVRLRVSQGDVITFIRRSVLAFESWAERKHIDLEFESDQESAQGYFDRDKLEKIVGNLVSNALKFTNEGGAVIVKVGIEDSRLRIRVEDTGCGISEHQLPRVFDRFYRADETHKTEGAGIGLALTKELVGLYHGTIAVESTAGKGSVFTVTVPINRSAFKPDEIVETAPPVTEGYEGVAEREPTQQRAALPASESEEAAPMILIVEDNADLRAYIREYLEPDYTVREAEDGKKGVEMALECIPDLIVSDIMMPGLDGYELTWALRQDVRTSHVPIILLTARAGTDDRIEGLERGADDYVTKPFDTRELGVRIRNLIEQRNLLRKKFSEGIELKPGEVSVTSLDDALLKKVMEVVEKNIGSEEFNVEDLARETFLSSRHLTRKLRAIAGMSTIELINCMRLQRARELLEKNAGTIAEIAYSVGFTNPAHFATSFRERFGIPPSEFLRKKS